MLLKKSGNLLKFRRMNETTAMTVPETFSGQLSHHFPPFRIGLRGGSEVLSHMGHLLAALRTGVVKEARVIGDSPSSRPCPVPLNEFVHLLLKLFPTGKAGVVTCPCKALLETYKTMWRRLIVHASARSQTCPR